MAQFSFPLEVTHALAARLPQQTESCGQTIRRFYESQVRWLDSVDEPPSKRRRLEESSDAALSTNTHEIQGYATLAEVSMLLNCDINPSSPTYDPTSLDKPIAVTIKDFGARSIDHSSESVLEGKDFCLTLSTEAGKPKDPSLQIFFRESIPAAAIPHLSTIISRCSQQDSRGQKTAARDEALRARCILAPDPARGSSHFVLRAQLLFKRGTSWRALMSTNAYRALGLDNIWKTYLKSDARKHLVAWKPQDFYSNVHVPGPNSDSIPEAAVPDVQCEMFPFQRRAVSWMLQREGFKIDDGGKLVPIPLEDTIPPSFVRVKDSSNHQMFSSQLLGCVTDAANAAFFSPDYIRGGILAEEMGLGKTVELIALICLHKRVQSAKPKVWDSYIGEEVTVSNATLIVTPPAILEQWKNELARHAPGLLVYQYDTVKRAKQTDEQIMRSLLDADVVLCQYNTLASEIHYADEKPDRPLRNPKRYKARRSPLVQISWWRCILDEAQMVESGLSNAAIVARRIPRCNAWAVSGTPLRKDVSDLAGLLIFLRYEPFCQSKTFELMLREYRHVFVKIFSSLALRHTKSQVRHELQLPPQRRIVLCMPFTAIEEQNYKQLFERMCEEIGCNVQGAPMSDDWDPDDTRVVERMRTWLSRLRQTCLHPEVGGRNRRALGRAGGPLRTVEEVLNVMIEQNETELQRIERAAVGARVLRGHFCSFGSDPRRALGFYLSALEQSSKVVEGCRSRLAIERHHHDESHDSNQARRTQRANSAISTDTDEDIIDAETRSRLQACQQRLRSALEVQHVCVFFTATAYFQIKASYNLVRLDTLDINFKEYERYEKLETDSYEDAKQVRRELLADATKKATRSMQKVRDTRRTTPIEVLRIKPSQQSGGIESRRVFEKIDMLKKVMDLQALQIIEWRDKLINLLLLRLIDEDDDKDLSGEEYEATTKQEDTMYAYIDGLRALIADRHCYLTGQVNILVNDEMKFAHAQSKAGQGHAPEEMQRIIETRDRLKPDARDPLSVRAIVSELRSMITAFQSARNSKGDRGEIEERILTTELEELQNMYSVQQKALTNLERERDIFRATMNARLDFYKQVQAISDSVVPLERETAPVVDEAEMSILEKTEDDVVAKLTTLKTKARYLLHLRDDAAGHSEQTVCVICQSPFANGVLTVCGHSYCKECIGIWWRQHHNCPMCKRRLTSNEFHDVSFRPRELRAQEENTGPSTSEPESPTKMRSSSSVGIYTEISASNLDEIKDIELRGSFGTKIDTLCRHILWLRTSDPGCKAIIFSQYNDFLRVLSQAFRTMKIGYTDMSVPKDNVAKFREDPSVECFLLSARSNASGLNLTDATHVFLCEPLINPSIELQAIARVHRIGQRRPTTVWMYIVSDSVEETIYDISVSRRLEHIRRATGPSESASTMADTDARDDALEAINSMELQSEPVHKLLAAGSSGGEVVAKADLWDCLFINAQKKPPPIENDGELGQVVGRHLRAEAADVRSREI